MEYEELLVLTISEAAAIAFMALDGIQPKGSGIYFSNPRKSRLRACVHTCHPQPLNIINTNIKSMNKLGTGDIDIGQVESWQSSSSK